MAGEILSARFFGLGVKRRHAHLDKSVCSQLEKTVSTTIHDRPEHVAAHPYALEDIILLRLDRAPSQRGQPQGRKRRFQHCAEYRWIDRRPGVQEEKKKTEGNASREMVWQAAAKIANTEKEDEIKDPNECAWCGVAVRNAEPTRALWSGCSKAATLRLSPLPTRPCRGLP